MNKIRNILLVALSVAMLSSCSLWNHETNGAILGGVGGTIIGGAVGEMLGGYHGSHLGSHIGATIGTVAGAAAGREKDRQEVEERYYGSYSDRNYNDNSYYDNGSGYTYERISRDGDIIFDSNSTRLSGSSARALDNIYRTLSRCRNDIYIYGSADGYERNAQTLSNRRANEVARYLIKRGISSRRIHTVALGNGSPIGNDRTMHGRALNRSVEIFIIR